MKRISIWPLVLMMCTLGETLAGAEAPLKVMTYNLRYASSSGEHAWPLRRPVAKSLVLKTQPDVFGTQEGLYEQLKQLATDLPAYQWIGLGRDGGSRGEFMAVFYREDRLEPLAYDHFWLSDTPDRIASETWGHKCRRMVTWVQFQDRETNRRFYFFNTHFDHQSRDARERSAGLVLRRVRALETDLPIVLVGDFNAIAPESKVYETLVGEDAFRDAWMSAGRHSELEMTFHGFRGPERARGRIDWILVRGPIEVQRAEVVTFSVDGQYPSDHFPVSASLVFQKP